MRTKLNEIIKNGHLGMIAVFFIVYMITFSYIEDRDVHHYIIHTTIDDQIPFCEYFIVPYLLWFLFVAVTVFYFMFFNKNQWKEYYQLVITLGTGMTLFLIISLVFPNGQDLRPVLTGDSIFIKADELAKELDISQGLAYKMIAQWNEELKAKGYTTVGGRVSRRYYQEKIYGAGEE